jgi:hypothetical protein
MGYHLKKIKKGVIGEVSKIVEEVEELEDSLTQDCKIMALVELSDMFGAMEAYLEKHHPGTTMDDLKSMSAITKRAFRDGSRK